MELAVIARVVGEGAAWGGRGMTGSSLTTVGGQSCVNEWMWAGGGEEKGVGGRVQ